VVCQDSATYGAGTDGLYLNPGPQAVVPWVDVEQRWVHTDSFAGWGTTGILCGNSGDPSVNPQLFDPPASGEFVDLYTYIWTKINAH
jgi:hypothetical protein